MHIFDAHCDVLYKMRFTSGIRFKDSSALHTNLLKMKQAGAKVQMFAIFVPDDIEYGSRFQTALDMVDLFYREIVAPFPEIKPVRSQSDIRNLGKDEIGVMLALEGCGPVGDNLIQLKTLLRLGVQSVGLTWNHANLAADGVLEERGAGLTAFGKDIVRTLNHSHSWVDVSHLAEEGFWEVMELGRYPIASHSNAKKLCSHPRNLTDDQIQALIKKDGMIGVTFVPQFLHNDPSQAALKDVLKHIDHICSLGGEHHLGFGSDFDGIETTAIGLADYRNYQDLLNTLLNYYSSSTVEKFAYENFVNHLPR